MKRLRQLLRVLAVLLAAACLIATCGIVASLSRGPTTPPVAMRIPDEAFSVPGVLAFARWEARRDARHSFRSDQALLLGYLHRHNVGELDGCVAGDYQRKTENEVLPQWLGFEADGVLTIECGSITMYLPVLEFGNPWDIHQVVYGRAFNSEILRLMKPMDAVEQASNPPYLDSPRNSPSS